MTINIHNKDDLNPANMRAIHIAYNVLRGDMGEPSISLSCICMEDDLELLPLCWETCVEAVVLLFDLVAQNTDDSVLSDGFFCLGIG